MIELSPPSGVTRRKLKSLFRYLINKDRIQIKTELVHRDDPPGVISSQHLCSGKINNFEIRESVTHLGESFILEYKITLDNDSNPIQNIIVVPKTAMIQNFGILFWKEGALSKKIIYTVIRDQTTNK